MATIYTREWIKFFKDCGIPEDVATVYALIFYENRIQKNMLLDLNKEYLKDMGITVMGDVIAILRHAKNVHDKYMREQILAGSDDVIEIRHDENSSESSPSSKKSTPVKRMLEHYARKYESPGDESPLEKVQINIQNEKSVVKVPKKLAHRIGPPNNPVKKKIEAPTEASEAKKSKLEVPVPKVRRVLPECEGGYKIKMPSGSTERSKKLLQQAKKKQGTVFDRLGESSVSSTTSEMSVVSFGSKSTETNGIVSKEKSVSSVFSRLGGKTSALVSSTSSFEEVVIIPDEQLPYSGVLKSSPIRKKAVSTPFTATMRADGESPKKASSLQKSQMLSVKKRLGTSADSSSCSVDLTDKKNLKAIKITTDFQEDDSPEPERKMKLSSRFSNPLEKREKLLEENTQKVVNNFGNFTIRPKKAAVTSTSSLAKVEGKVLKRKIGGEISVDNDDDDEDDLNVPSKKVRFGKTTHRLIPGNTSVAETGKKLKNYPNLTMRIQNAASVKNRINNNRVNIPEISSGLKISSLNSDKAIPKPTVKERIGNKSLAERLGNKINLPKGLNRNSIKLKNGVKKATSSIHDRLG